MIYLRDKKGLHVISYYYEIEMIIKNWIIVYIQSAKSFNFSEISVRASCVLRCLLGGVFHDDFICTLRDPFLLVCATEYRPCYRRSSRSERCVSARTHKRARTRVSSSRVSYRSSLIISNYQ